MRPCDSLTDSGATRAARSRTPEARRFPTRAAGAGRREKYYNPGAYLLKKVSGYPDEGSANLQSPVRRVFSLDNYLSMSSHTRDTHDNYLLFQRAPCSRWNLSIAVEL